jgi:hypothetical protein
MSVCMCVGMVTLLCMWSDTLAGGVGAHNGWVSIMRPGDSAARLWPIVQGG